MKRVRFTETQIVNTLNTNYDEVNHFIRYRLFF